MLTVSGRLNFHSHPLLVSEKKVIAYWKESSLLKFQIHFPLQLTFLAIGSTVEKKKKDNRQNSTLEKLETESFLLTPQFHQLAPLFFFFFVRGL